MLDMLLQEEGEWDVPLVPGTPVSVLDAIDLRTYAYSTIYVIPHRFDVDDLSRADVRDIACYAGVYLGQGDKRLNLFGSGLAWWLGQENDGGDIITTDATSANLDLEDQLDGRVFANSNGLTKGSVNALATQRTIKQEAGTTRRQMLDTICALYPNDFEWRVNADGTIDVDTPDVLYPSYNPPTTFLVDEGGREGWINGIRSELELVALDVEDYRTAVHVDWDDALSTQSATNTPTATWNDFAGNDPDIETLIDWRPKRTFRERPNKSDRWNAAHYAAYVVNSTAQATRLATRHATNTASYAVELTARVDEYDPFRFVGPGHYVYVHDVELGLVNADVQVYFRGEAIHPVQMRVQGMSTPILDGYSVFLDRGNTGTLYDLTPYVDFEEGDTILDIGTRRRFRPRRARPKPYSKAAVRRAARRHYMLQLYLQRVS